MSRADVEIPVPDGVARGSLHVPDGDGPWPGVLVFPDAGGLRETFREMGDRIAGLGYVALIPDIYYREGDWAPFDMATAFSDEKERARLFGVMGRLTNERIIADSDAYADFLLARPEVSGSAIGTTGYCLGGRMSMLAAGGIGDKIAAAASFHGGRIAVADDPTSPHLAADRIAATASASMVGISNASSIDRSSGSSRPLTFTTVLMLETLLPRGRPPRAHRRRGDRSH